MNYKLLTYCISYTDQDTGLLKPLDKALQLYVSISLIILLMTNNRGSYFICVQLPLCLVPDRPLGVPNLFSEKTSIFNLMLNSTLRSYSAFGEVCSDDVTVCHPARGKNFTIPYETLCLGFWCSHLSCFPIPVQ